MVDAAAPNYFNIAAAPNYFNNAANDITCSFSWETVYPFLPFRTLQSVFFHGHLTDSTQWTVRLEPLSRHISYKTCTFILKYDNSFDYRDEILANTISIIIYLDRNPIMHMNAQNYRFTRRNRYTYSFDFFASVLEPKTIPILVVQVVISLPRYSANPERDVLEINADNPRLLSEDLYRLYQEFPHSNMQLRSIPDNEIFNVHSYIINTRWNNFFTLNDFHPIDQSTVEVRITSVVLSTLLAYLYSSQSPVPVHGGHQHFAELFQIIYQYRLYHLYKCYVRSDFHQTRNDLKSIHIIPIVFPLIVVNGMIRAVFLPYHFFVSPNNNLDLTVHVTYENGGGPWLSYSARANTRTRHYVHVKLEKVTTLERLMSTITPVHECDYTIDPRETIESGPVLFLGCPETFGDVTGPRRRGVSHQIAIILHITDGIYNTIIHHADRPQVNRLERFHALGDDMYKLMYGQNASDFIIQAAPEEGEDEARPEVEGEARPEVEGEADPEVGEAAVTNVLNRIHKGIFEIRVPRWRAVLVDCADLLEMPDEARCTLTRNALRYVLDYIYTGKSFPIPDYLFDQIREFAQNGECRFSGRMIEFDPERHR